jgi:SagB-type dehydrogenase family enzyme
VLHSAMESLNKMPWKALTRVLSSPEADDRIEIRSRLTGRRFLVDRDLIATMLITGNPEAVKRFAALDVIGDPDDGPPGVTHWMERGWEEAIETYVASRSALFIEDSVAPEQRERIRSDTVRAMLDERPIPNVPIAGSGAVKLAVPDVRANGYSLGEVLARRRTTPYFSGKPVSVDALAATLWNGLYAVRANRQGNPTENPLDALQSIGSAFDAYVISYNVKGLDPGSYFYEPERHVVELRGPGDHSSKFEKILIGQPSPKRACASILLVVDFPRYQWRYRHERALRLLYFEAGRLMQYLLVAATAAGMATHVTPAMRDSEVLTFLGLPSSANQAMYCLTLGAR